MAPFLGVRSRLAGAIYMPRRVGTSLDNLDLVYHWQKRYRGPSFSKNNLLVLLVVLLALAYYADSSDGIVSPDEDLELRHGRGRGRGHGCGRGHGRGRGRGDCGPNDTADTGPDSITSPPAVATTGFRGPPPTSVPPSPPGTSVPPSPPGQKLCRTCIAGSAGNNLDEKCGRDSVKGCATNCFIATQPTPGAEIQYYLGCDHGGSRGVCPDGAGQPSSWKGYKDHETCCGSEKCTDIIYNSLGV